MTLTYQERSALLAVLRGAQDDDDGSDPQYTKALASIVQKVRRDRVAA